MGLLYFNSGKAPLQGVSDGRPSVRSSQVSRLHHASVIERKLYPTNLPDYLFYLDCGGPGSGCHGDNCGRPKGLGKMTAPSLMKHYGWTKISYGKNALGHVVSEFTHPMYGLLKINHDKQTWTHQGITGQPKDAGSIGKNGSLPGYMSKVHEALFTPSTPKAAEAPKPTAPAEPSKGQEVPAGMHQQYQSSVATYTWNPQEGVYEKVYKAGPGYVHTKLAPDHIQNFVAKNFITPVGVTQAPAPVEEKKSGPPPGMPQSIKGPAGGVYHWNDENQNYQHGTNSNYTVSKEHAQANLGTKYKAVGPVTPADAATGGPKPPNGMAEQYKGNKSGNTYTWNSNTGLYHVTNFAGSPAGAQYTPASLSGMMKNLSPVTGDKPATTEAKPAANIPGNQRPPNNMAQQYDVAGNTYTWHSGDNEFKKSGGFGSFSHETLAKMAKAGIAKPIGTEPQEAKETIAPPPKQAPSDDFTYVGSGKNLGGAHDKYIFSDKSGAQWLFKPATTLSGQTSPMMAHADEAVSKIAQILRPNESVEAKAITVNIPDKGEMFGSIQKMVSPNDIRTYKDFGGRQTSDLKPWEIKALQQEQVLDWLISNHDSHEGQFIRLKDRRLVGIDKTQAFKYFPTDQLSDKYQPNTDKYGEKAPIYNQMWNAVKSGTLKVDTDSALETIKRAEAIPEKDYKAMLKPYADSRFGTDEKGKAAFMDAAIERKNNLRSDFEKFYGNTLGKSNFKFEAQYDPNAQVEVGFKHAHKAEVLPDNVASPSARATIEAMLPSMMKKWSEGGSDMAMDKINAWQSNIKYQNSNLSQSEKLLKAADGKGLYVEMAAKLGLTPETLKQVHGDISDWKGSTESKGAAHIRAAAQEVVSPDKCCSSQYSKAWELEAAITRAKLATIFPGSKESGVLLRRGLTDDPYKNNYIATELKKAAKSGGTVKYATMGAEGWTENVGTAKTFGGSGSGVMLETHIPLDNIITSWRTNTEAMSSFIGEKEFFLAFPNKTQLLKSTEIKSAKGPIMPKKVVTVDGTTQSHRAIPPEWKMGKGKPVPVEVVHLELVDKNGKPVLKK